jgi:hypothetical protein
MATSILTDIEMTALIIRHTKGGSKVHDQIRDSWLDFTEQAFHAKSGDRKRFIDVVNQWLKHRKIPIVVTDFNPMDEDIGGTDWTVDVDDKRLGESNGV